MCPHLPVLLKADSDPVTDDMEVDESSSDGALSNDDASSSGEVLASLRWPCVCGLFLLFLLQGGIASERRRLHVSRPHGLNVMSVMQHDVLWTTTTREYRNANRSSFVFSY